MYVNLAGTGHNLVWWHPCPADITAELVSLANRNGMITNSDLDLTALVLQEATLLESVPKACMALPRSVSDNTSNVSWGMREA